jgi:hypothetical protein
LKTAPVSRDSSVESPRYRSASVLIAGACAIGLWIPWLHSSFWLDETGTAWVVNGSLGDAIRRSGFEGQTPLYYVIAWFARHLPGPQELALRLPSLIAVVLTTFVVYRLAKRLFNPEAAILAAGFFAMGPGVASAASNARPYAFGLLLIVSATFFLVRWMDEGRWMDGAVYVILAALTLYSNYVFGLSLLPHLLYVVLRFRRNASPSRRKLFLVGAGVAALSTPAVLSFVHLASHRDLLLFIGGRDSALNLLGALLYGALAAGVLLGGSLALVSFHPRVSRTPITKAALPLVISWAAVAPVILYVLAHTVSHKFFQDRYYGSALPGGALLIGWLISFIRSVRAQAIIVLCVAVMALSTYRGGLPAENPWREVARKVNGELDDARTPVFFAPGFAGDYAAITGERRGLLLAPVVVYPIHGRILLLPWEGFAAKELPHRADLAAVARASNHFFVVSGFALALPAVYRDWFALVTPKERFSSRDERLGDITVTEFRKIGSG